MTLKTLVGQKIMDEVIRYHGPSGQGSQRIEWRVLIVDQLSMRILSACCKMADISEEGITLVEDIHKKREPLGTMDAIYLITPTEKSVHALINDFATSEGTMYKTAHVFFTEACPDALFSQLSHSRVAKYIKTLKEINIAFIPCEQQVFTLGSPESFHAMYGQEVDSRVFSMERAAEQIATLCATLGEYPSIRYRSDWETNIELAQLVQQKLDGYKADDPTMGEGAEKSKSQLIILDRGFDCVSPLIHELTFQAMAYDLLPIENDVYKYEAGQGQVKEVLLDESDELWVELRHQHIAVVSNLVTTNLKKFTESKQMGVENSSMRDLSQLIKRMPQHQKELSKYATHLRLAEDCIQTCSLQQDINSQKLLLCKVEEELATGVDSEGETINDHMRRIVPIIVDQDVSTFNKMRIIALYIMAKNGTSEDNLNKLVSHGNLKPSDRQTLLNLAQLGVNVVGGSKPKQCEVARKERVPAHSYQMSRCTPVIKDMMEDAIDDKLDQRYFPFLGERVNTSGYQAPTSVRYGHWHKEKAQQTGKNLPRLIIFVVGGVSYSEIRCAYEVSAAKNWEVIVGSSHILTPNSFLQDLSSLA